MEYLFLYNNLSYHFVYSLIFIALEKRKRKESKSRTWREKKVENKTNRNKKSLKINYSSLFIINVH